MEVYIVEIKEEPKATSEIDEITWIDTSYQKKRIILASINQDYLIPALKASELID